MVAAWALVLLLGWSAHAPPPLRRAKLSRVGAPLCIDYDVDEPLTAPRDELKVRFSRGDESTATKNTFVEPSAAAAQRAAVAQQQQGRMSNEELLEEIRGLMPADPAEAEEPPEATPVDLNGIKPRDLLIGAASYGVFSYLAWQFTNVAATYFADHPAQATDFYVVSRLTSFARVVVVGVAALGAGVTAIAGAGQAALAVKVAQGIAAGELDPTAERVDPTGGRKGYELDRMLKMMRGERPKDKE